MHNTCRRRETIFRRSPTILAVLPPIPMSTSSKMSVGTLSTSDSTVLIASMTRESSPPEATFTSGLSGSPGLAERRNSTESTPDSSILQRTPPRLIPAD